MRDLRLDRPVASWCSGGASPSHTNPGMPRAPACLGQCAAWAVFRLARHLHSPQPRRPCRAGCRRPCPSGARRNRPSPATRRGSPGGWVGGWVDRWPAAERCCRSPEWCTGAAHLAAEDAADHVDFDSVAHAPRPLGGEGGDAGCEGGDTGCEAAEHRRRSKDVCGRGRWRAIDATRARGNKQRTWTAEEPKLINPGLHNRTSRN